VGPVGLEPTTNGLKVRRTLLRPVSSCGLLCCVVRLFGPASVQVVSSRVLLLRPVRLHFGLHGWRVSGLEPSRGVEPHPAIHAPPPVPGRLGDLVATG